MIFYHKFSCVLLWQKQPSVGIFMKSVLKVFSKFTREYPCRSVISIKNGKQLANNFTEITIRHGCFPANLLHFSEHFFLTTPQEGWLMCMYNYWLNLNLPHSLVWTFNSFMQNVEKWPNILWESCGVDTARFLKYIWPFFNIMHERVNQFLTNAPILYPLKTPENKRLSGVFRGYEWKNWPEMG